MADPRGFLTERRDERPLRPIPLRLMDFEDVHAPSDAATIRRQAQRCMGCGVPFCHSGCPLGNLIPDWNELVYQEDWQRAWRRLEQTNNFPEFTGALCPAPCEDACVLALNDDPVAIKDIEMEIVERAFLEGWVKPHALPPATGKSVAVVGSGPAGLAAAQQLRRAGHRVTVFERDDRIGGLLRYGIPDFKQPKSAIDRRLVQLEAEGIEFQTGFDIGIDTDLDDLLARYDAVILATGAQAHRDLPLPGRDLDGIHFAMPYLIQRNRQVAGLPATPDAGPAISAAGRRVAIIGAGDTSADCLGNVLREGAEAVYEIGHGPKPPRDAARLPSWPDRPFLLREYPVHHEGGERVWQWEPEAFSGNGRVTRLSGHRVQYQDPDSQAAQGRGKPRIAVEGEPVHLDVDLVLIAVGFTGVEREKALLQHPDLRLSDRDTIDVSNFETSIRGVFAAGDCVRGADLIVTAISQGRECARTVDGYLAGWTDLPSRDAVRMSHLPA